MSIHFLEKMFYPFTVSLCWRVLAGGLWRCLDQGCSVRLASGDQRVGTRICTLPHESARRLAENTRLRNRISRQKVTSQGLRPGSALDIPAGCGSEKSVARMTHGSSGLNPLDLPTQREQNSRCERYNGLIVPRDVCCRALPSCHREDACLCNNKFERH